MYLVEFEESMKDNRAQTVVRIIDPTADPPGQVIAETVYLGSPPGLCFQTGTTFTVLRLPSSQQ